MRLTSNQRQVVKASKYFTERFREAVFRATGVITNEISHEEFIARRNRIGSSKYQFHFSTKEIKPTH